MPKLTINPNKCVGCRQCNIEYPDNFGTDEYSNTSYVKKSEGGEGMIEKCPTGAISIYKES
jgi:ferredoxin